MTRLFTIISCMGLLVLLLTPTFFLARLDHLLSIGTNPMEDHLTDKALGIAYLGFGIAVVGAFFLIVLWLIGRWLRE